MDRQSTFRLALTGDNIVMRRISVHQDEPSRRLVDLIRDADVAFTNLEVLPNDFRGYPALECGGTHLAAPSFVLDDLLAMGFDLFACANNHSLDYSIEGLVATIEALERRDTAFAGIGRTLADARMPVYLDHGTGSLALIACTSTFAKGQEAGEQRPDMQGRPGLNPLRFDTTHEVTRDQLETLRTIADRLGLEQQRLERIQLGFAFPPDAEDIFPFLDANFREADQPAIKTTPKAQDLEAIVTWAREARTRADTLVVSFHGHEQGTSKEEPPEFVRSFAHRMIDEGADVVVGHGPHLLRGMEIYGGKPIFYSLGNFVGQNELVYKLPADSYERFRVDLSKTPGEVFRTRTEGDTKSFPADKRYWQTVVPILQFANGRLDRIEVVPVSLGHGEASHRRGRPRLAEGTEANEILTRFAALSEGFGTMMEREGERAVVRLGTEANQPRLS
ncbi:MAG: CapA family protein [Chloroflexota bacterium]|nr:CapA family protein [Chloroflexota bacterium]